MWSYLALILALSAQLIQGEFEALERSMEEIQEEVARTSILIYDEQEIDDVDETVSEIEAICKCEVQHLSHIQGFILHYTESNHLPASTFLNITGIVDAEEDEVVGPPNDPPVDEEDREFTLDSRQSNRATNDPYFSRLWAFGNQAAGISWQQGRQKYLADSQGGSSDGPSVIVAVVDTGVDYNHPDLKSAMWSNPDEIPGNGKDDDNNGYVDDVHGINLIGGSRPRGDPMDQNGHGTHCAGTISAVADNGQGIAGVAGISLGKVKIMAIRTIPGGTSQILRGLDYAIDKGAKVSSNSYGCTGCGGARTLASFLRRHPEHLFVSAAGNDNIRISSSGRNSAFPANAVVSNHISVAASTSGDSRARFSNYGTPYVNVFAPGTRILSTIPNRRYTSLQGTSMACPHVSGLAALVMSMREDLTPAQVKQLIEQNVQTKGQYRGVVTSGGLIDVEKTVSAVPADDDDDGDNDPTTTTPEPTTTTTPEQDCEDVASYARNCQRYSYACQWKGYGWFAYDYCPNTCGNCNSDCKNIYGDRRCRAWNSSRRRYCTRGRYVNWMGKNCARTCNTCP